MASLVIFIAIFIIGIIVSYGMGKKNQKEEAFSALFITIGIDLIVTSFGTVIDKIFGLLSNESVTNNYAQLAVGFIILIIGLTLYRYSKNKLFVLNINGYYDRTIENHKDELKLSAFEFKEREIDFIRAYKKGMSKSVAKDIREELEIKIKRFKDETSHSRRAYTGIAPIPFIMLAGNYFTRQDIHEYFEYDKLNSVYYKLEDLSRGQVPQLELTNSIDSIDALATEIVLAISLTSPITSSDIQQFSCQAIHMSVDNPGDNKIRSKQQLQNYYTEIYNTLEKIKIKLPNVKKIHLLYSGQSCLAFELGKLIDDRRTSQVISYQYDIQGDTKYPWGIIINGNDKGKYINIS
ncbi:SAVED domain-containing protein [Priestia megaterium]